MQAMKVRSEAEKIDHKLREMEEDEKDAQEEAKDDLAEADAILESLEKEEGEARRLQSVAAGKGQDAEKGKNTYVAELQRLVQLEKDRHRIALSGITAAAKKLQVLEDGVATVSVDALDSRIELAQDLSAKAVEARRIADDGESRLSQVHAEAGRLQEAAETAQRAMLDRLHGLQKAEKEAREDAEKAARDGVAAGHLMLESAAFRVQGAYRRRKARFLMRAMVKSCYVKFWDEASGTWMYFNTHTKQFSETKPIFLGDDDIMSEEQKGDLEQQRLSAIAMRKAGAAEVAEAEARALEAEAAYAEEEARVAVGAAMKERNEEAMRKIESEMEEMARRHEAYEDSSKVEEEAEELQREMERKKAALHAAAMEQQQKEAEEARRKALGFVEGENRMLVEQWLKEAGQSYKKMNNNNNKPLFERMYVYPM